MTAGGKIDKRLSRNARRRRKRQLDSLNSPKPPRTPNRFILYRRHKQQNLFNDPENPVDMRKLSRVIADMWKEETPEVKKQWDQEAANMKIRSSYRSSFDNIIGLDMSISDDEVPFVNATASLTATSANNFNEDCFFPSSRPINFIFEFPIPNDNDSIDNNNVESPPQSPSSISPGDYSTPIDYLTPVLSPNEETILLFGNMNINLTDPNSTDSDLPDMNLYEPYEPYEPYVPYVPYEPEYNPEEFIQFEQCSDVFMGSPDEFYPR